MKSLPIIAAALLALSACTTVRHIPVHTSATDSLRTSTVRTDTLHILDSIIIDRSADTLRIDRWHTRRHITVVHDTLWRQRTDTVTTIVEVPVPARRTPADILTLIGAAALGAAAATIISRLRRR